MSRFAAGPSFARMLSVALVVLLAMAIGLGPTPAAAIDPAFTQFEDPDTTQVLDPCLSEAVKRRIGELQTAVERMDRKMERMTQAYNDLRHAIETTTDPVARRSLMAEYTEIGRWLVYWRAYWATLKNQIHYYVFASALFEAAQGNRGRMARRATRPAATDGNRHPRRRLGPVRDARDEGSRASGA